nr:transposon Ty3-I Gag-Pol polyprotein [Tanacetum cinerariifolium]
MFVEASIPFFGHIISAQGVQADPEKVVAIQAWPTPSSFTHLRAFLGLTEPFDITTDASGVAIGAVLSQKDKPISFFSKKLCDKMKGNSTYIRELYAITEAVKKQRQYFLATTLAAIFLKDIYRLHRIPNSITSEATWEDWLKFMHRFLVFVGHEDMSAVQWETNDTPEPNAAVQTKAAQDKARPTRIIKKPSRYLELAETLDKFRRTSLLLADLYLNSFPMVLENQLLSVSLLICLGRHDSVGRIPSVAARDNQKLSKRYFGPYRILEKVGPVAYRLELPVTSRVHPVFHVSLLKESHQEQEPSTEFPTDWVTNQPEQELQPDSILQHRQSDDKYELLIKWKNQDQSEATWEDFNDISSRFPSFIGHEDESTSNGGKLI